MQPNKHRETIIAWAGGAQIQYKEPGATKWTDCISSPNWYSNHEYRVKPEEPERVYPVTKMNREDFKAATGYVAIDMEVHTDIANAALRHACDNGQVVTREEFDHV